MEIELGAMGREIEKAMQSGDLDELRAARQRQEALKDEEKILYRQRTDVHQEITAARGREALEATPKLRKDLAAAVEQARAAQEAIAECLRTASRIIAARGEVAAIGQKLLFDPLVIQDLASTVYPDGNDRKQLMIDLGIIDAKHAQRTGQFK